MRTDANTILGSEARTATATSGTITNAVGLGMILKLDVTAVTATPNLSAIAVEMAVGSGWLKVYEWTGLTIATVSKSAFLLYPGAASAGSWTAAPLQGVCPRTFRVVVTHDDADSITYSLDAEFVA